MTTDFCLLEMEKMVGAVGGIRQLEEEGVMVVVEQMVDRVR